MQLSSANSTVITRGKIQIVLPFAVRNAIKLVPLITKFFGGTLGIFPPCQRGSSELQDMRCLFCVYVSTVASPGDSPSKGMLMPSHFFPVVSKVMSHFTGWALDSCRSKPANLNSENM